MPRWVALLAPLLLAACHHPGVGALNDTMFMGDLTITRNIAYELGPRHELDVYQPDPTGTGRPLVIFIYGGAWSGGSKDYYPFVAASIAYRGAVVMVPDYRVYPQTTYPGFLQDNAKAVAWAIAHAAQYGADPHRVFLVGHSAGAYNAAMLAMDSAWLGQVGLSPSDLTGVVGIAGPYDFLPMDDPDIAVVFGPAATSLSSQPITYANAHAPPMLLLVGSDDHTVGEKDTIALYNRLHALGAPVSDKIYPGIGHIGIVAAFAPVLRWYAPTLRDTWQFIASHPAPTG